jgi:hypothetical protein
MEQEHMIIIALLVVALYFLMMRKPCACPIRPSQGFSERFENVGTEQVPVIGAGWIRKREDGGSIGLVNKETPISHIRTRRQDDNQGFGLQHVQSRNHNMYQSQYVRHHLKADHRGKMMNSMMRGEGPDSAGMYE